MVSVVLASSYETSIVNRAIDSVMPQLDSSDELIIISPDFKMEKIVSNYNKKYKNIRLLKDKREGKPIALNMGFKISKGEIFILTDGDIYLEKDAISLLKRHFVDKSVGAVSGHPVSIDNKNNLFGFWAYVLTEIAHELRTKRSAENKFFECSGYLYAFRKESIKDVKEDSLADDAVITHSIARANYNIQYEPKAIVYVKYPKNYKDWISQKVRSVGGYAQKHVTNSDFKMRNFLFEATNGLSSMFKYSKNIKELFWLLLLFLARLHVWLLILVKVKLQKQPLTKLWTSIRSTK